MADQQTPNIAAAGNAFMAIAYCQTPARIGAIGSWLMGCIVPQNQAPAEGAAPARQGAVRQVAGVEGPAGSVAPAGQPGEVAR